MAFIQLAGRKAGTGGFKAALSQVVSMQKSPKSHGAKLAIANDVWLQMGSPKYVKMYRGSGEHAGMLLLKPAATKGEDTFTLTGKPKGQKHFNVSAQRVGHKFPVKFSTVECEFSVVDEGLVVTLPTFASPQDDVVPAMPWHNGIAAHA